LIGKVLAGDGGAHWDNSTERSAGADAPISVARVTELFAALGSAVMR